MPLSTISIFPERTTVPASASSPSSPSWAPPRCTPGWPGSYFRVIDEGEIQAGDEIEIVHQPDHDVTVAMTFRALTVEPELLPQLLVADALPRDIKELARRRTA